MNNNEQYTVMVARCEATARGLDHALDVWYPVSEHLRKEQRWRIGGAALQQECLEDNLGAAAAD
jgi:hypothetical protein